MNITKGKTQCTVAMEISDAYVAYLTKVWPKALKKEKHLQKNS
ncbi:hypothetical protein [Pareuzebyella sediminis]|nr:hypothetical protein [Pareuzebyella sediminis]